MGIRFYCPNGHKLNVKEHLAGKAGFCPECGVRLVIPFESTRKSSKELREEAFQDALTKPTLSAAPATVSSATPDDDELGLAPTEPAPKGQPEGAFTDPILLDKTVVWYVQVPGGPQYGPAAGSVIHSWIQQGRISADMLVWREGWENWLEARSVFPELG